VATTSCSARVSRPQSSLVEAGRGGRPQDPDASVPALYIAGHDLRLDPRFAAPHADARGERGRAPIRCSPKAAAPAADARDLRSTWSIASAASPRSHRRQSPLRCRGHQARRRVCRQVSARLFRLSAGRRARCRAGGAGQAGAGRGRGWARHRGGGPVAASATASRCDRAVRTSCERPGEGRCRYRRRQEATAGGSAPAGKEGAAMC
jgi:hypothetical protein